MDSRSLATLGAIVNLSFFLSIFYGFLWRTPRWLFHRQAINMQMNVRAEMRPPSKHGMPVIVDFNIFVADVNSINVEDMDFR